MSEKNSLQASTLPAETPWDFYRTQKEVRKSRRRTEEWIIPTIEQFYGKGAVPRVLSVGCGSAVDVAVLRQHGYDCWGTDLNPEFVPVPEKHLSRRTRARCLSNPAISM